MSEAFYRDVLDALVGFLPDDLATFEHRLHARGLKVWFGDVPREHFEVQEVGRYAHRSREHKGRALEIGFHAEHADAARNQAVLDRLTGAERSWSKALGADAEAGVFVGDRSKTWRRVSEFWTGPEIDEPDAAIEAADRLAAYIAALQPIVGARAPR